MPPAPDAPRGEVVVYQSPDGAVRVDVQLEQDTAWLSLGQIAELFGRDKSVIGKHLRRIFADGELDRAATAAKFAAVQLEGGREVMRDVEFFNLDAILSVGYRVNSRRGTQFRIWATRTLREHFVRGFTLNEQRLQEIGLRDAQQAITLLARTLGANALVTDEGRAVIHVVQHYARTWHWLFEYDGEQTFDRQPLYQTAQERAAHLLYFVVKDHPFADGNKRIGALLFLEFLRRNGLLVGADGRLRLPDTATAALTLLIAESKPTQKGLMVRLVMSLLGDAAGDGGASSVAEPHIAYGCRETRLAA